MEGYLPLKLKRKEFDDDFSDFSLSYPATKIRRLDAELPPIIEDEECDIPLDFEQSVPQEQGFNSISSGGLRIVELPENEERAIVPFETPNPLLHSPSNFSVSVNPLLILGLKNQVLWSNSLKLPNSDSSGCQAVVPWVPPQFPCASELMDDASMDVNEVYINGSSIA